MHRPLRQKKPHADTESIDNVAAAFSSKNAGYNYELAIGYAQKAADLYHQGLTGTDDFQILLPITFL